MPMMQMSQLDRILSFEYDINPLRAPREVVSWAAYEIARAQGINEAERQVSDLNLRRHKRGLPLAYIDKITLN